jgi:hypothetical protein
MFYPGNIDRLYLIRVKLALEEHYGHCLCTPRSDGF